MVSEKINIKGTLSRIISYSERRGIIFILMPLGSVYEDGIKVKINKKVVSGCPVPCIGQIWDIAGAYDNTDSYGEQIIAESAQIIIPTGKDIVDFLGKNPDFAGIGVKTAKKLWTLFGEELYEILNSKDVAKLLSKFKLSETLINTLFEKWTTFQETILIIKFLNEIKFPSVHAWKAYELWGSNVQGYITEDPYRLLALADWKQVDRCARRYFSVPQDSELRHIAAVESALYDAYDDKQTGQFQNELSERVRNYLDESKIKQAICLALADKRIRIDFDFNGLVIYQLAEAQALEDSVEKRIQEIESTRDNKFDESSLNDIEDTLPYKLTASQRKAIRKVVEKAFSIILGARGVGKKTVLKAVLRMLPSSAIVMQLTLTIQSAKCVSDLTNYHVISVGELLQSAADTGLPENLFLFIYDASVLDLPTFYKILHVLPTGARLCLIGDPNQLPPNGPGLVLHKFIIDLHSNVVSLVDVLDIDLKNNISTISGAIRSSAEFMLEEFEPGRSKVDGVSFLRVEEDKLVDSLIYTYRELSEIGDAQIIAARDETCAAINAVLHFENVSMREYQKLSLETILGKDSELIVGDKIIYSGRTDHARGLNNGSVGILLEIFERPIIITNEINVSVVVAEAYFSTAGKIQLTEEDINHIGLAYCVILDGSHFGQWEHVIVASESIDSNALVNKRWFYTAVTRGIKQCVIVGSLNYFQLQMNKPFQQIERCVGLNFKRPLTCKTNDYS